MIPANTTALLDPLQLQRQLLHRRNFFSLHPTPKESESVLLVDEDDETRGQCNEILRLAGFDVIETDSFFKAYNLLRVHALPKAIVTDYWVGGRTTEDFLTLLGSKKKLFQRVPLVLMSAHHQLEKRAQHLGARHFLAKPICAETLVAAVHSLDPH